MKKIITILFILGLNSVFAQFTRIQDLPEASKIRATDLFLLTQDTTYLGGLNYKSRQLSFDDFMDGFGYKSSRSIGTNGNLIIGASSRIDSVVSHTVANQLILSDGSALISLDGDTLKDSPLNAVVRFEVIGGLGESRFQLYDKLEAIVIRDPIPPFKSYTKKKIQATVIRVNGDILTLNYEAGREDTLKIGDVFTKVGNALASRLDRQKTILLDTESDNSPCIAGWDNIDSFSDWNNPIVPKFAIGNLNRFTSPIFGDSLGYGVLTTNFYGSGGLALSGESSDSFLSGIASDLFIAYGDKIGFWKGSEGSFRTYLKNDGSIYASGTDTTTALFHFNAPANTLEIIGGVVINSGVTYNQIQNNKNGVLANASSISVNSSGISLNSSSITTANGNIATNTSLISLNAGNILLRARKDSLISLINLSGEGVDISGDYINLNGNTSVDGSFSISGDVLSGGKFTTAGGAKFGNDVLTTYDGLFIDADNYILDNNTFILGGANGIIHNGVAISFGSNVSINGSITSVTNINASNISSGIFTTTGGSKFGTDVSSTNDGLYINSDNYILDNNSFRIGGLTGITYSGTGSIGIGSNVVVNGAVFGSNTINGTTTIGSTGSVVTGATSTRMELLDDGLFAYNSGTLRAKIANDGSGFLGSSSALSWTNAGVLTMDGGTANITNINATNITTGALTGINIWSSTGSSKVGLTNGDALEFYYGGTKISGISAASADKISISSGVSIDDALSVFGGIDLWGGSVITGKVAPGTQPTLYAPFSNQWTTPNNFSIGGNLNVTGTILGTINATGGATGTYSSVTVVNGIVTSGTP